MRTLFNIHPHYNELRLEQCHLLILGLLNFEHTVHIVFHSDSYNKLKKDQELAKKWQSLHLYGAQDFLFINSMHDNLNNQHYQKLCQQADFIS